MKKENNVKKMRWNMKNPDSLKWYFLIGALIGAVLFVLIYGFSVLNVTNDAWLMTGKDLQQHYIGWKYYRDAAWNFPIGLHDGLTHPYMVSVLYTDSIPLFAIFFKALSPLLPETFQYFGLFGLMCYMLNGGFAALIVAKIRKNKLYCAMGSVFFILSTPVLQRMFGLLTQNSRHTSLAAHFLILAPIAIWMYRDRFQKIWKAAAAFAILGALCVLIQMYIIFIVGGLMCGYLFHSLLEERKWKRVFIVFGSFVAAFLVTFFVVGGFTDVLDSGSNGFGLYSANLNALINPYEYSSFFPEMGMRSGQYEGFAYLGLGMIVLCAIGIGLLIRRMIQMHKEKKLWIRMKQFIKKHASGLVSLSIVVIVFGSLALTTWVYIGKHIILQVYLPQFCYDVLAIVRSSGRFIWVIMYMAMIFGLYMAARMIRNKKVCTIIVAVCLCLQLMDLAKPISRIHKQYTSEPVAEESMVKNAFWDTQLKNYKHIVYYPVAGYGLYQMMQVGTKASMVEGMDVNYFYMSRFIKYSLIEKENKEIKKKFTDNALDDDTLYIVDYRSAHKYKNMANFYEVDNKILASKNPIADVPVYRDVYLSAESPYVELDFSDQGLGKKFAHSGWNETDFGDDGTWTSGQSVVRLLSGGAKKAHVTVEYEAGKKKGTTKIKVNGNERAKLKNNESGIVEFDTTLKTTTNEHKGEGVNWLFFNTDSVFKSKHNDDDITCGIYVKKITVTYLR